MEVFPSDGTDAIAVVASSKKENVAAIISIGNDAGQGLPQKVIIAIRADAPVGLETVPNVAGLVLYAGSLKGLRT